MMFVHCFSKLGFYSILATTHFKINIEFRIIYDEKPYENRKELPVMSKQLKFTHCFMFSHSLYVCLICK